MTEEDRALNLLKNLFYDMAELSATERTLDDDEYDPDLGMSLNQAVEQTNRFVDDLIEKAKKHPRRKGDQEMSDNKKTMQCVDSLKGIIQPRDGQSQNIIFALKLNTVHNGEFPETNMIVEKYINTSVMTEEESKELTDRARANQPEPLSEEIIALNRSCAPRPAEVLLKSEHDHFRQILQSFLYACMHMVKMNTGDSQDLRDYMESHKEDYPSFTEIVDSMLAGLRGMPPVRCEEMEKNDA